jgi:spore germination protein GerM
VRRFLQLLTVVVVGLALAGCGVGAQQHAVVIPSGDVPTALGLPLTSPSPVPSSPSLISPSSSPPSEGVSLPSTSGSTRAASVYLVDDATNRLVAVHRSRNQIATLATLIHTLLSGPTEAESAAGLTTAINTSPTVNKITIQGSLAIIDLSSTFGDIRGAAEVLASAQVVLTAVSYPGTDSVLFTLDGTATAVPLVSGVLSSSPLTYSDYASLLAPAPSTP